MKRLVDGLCSLTIIEASARAAQIMPSNWLVKEYQLERMKLSHSGNVSSK